MTGFYSAFMVADKVEINTLSYQDNAEPALWECDGGTEFQIKTGSRMQRGTDIILHIGNDGAEFLTDYKLRSVLRKYCNFMPVDIYFENVANIEDNPKPINDKKPLWQQKPSDCTDEDYIKFYRDLFMDFNEPLFWIHLNMDHPFRLKGILYFPRLKHELEYVEGQVKLFSNQVFVADNIKEVIPEFLLLLKGVMDCPDLPLNVSRSFLQNDGVVEKMSGYIIRKVADKLTNLAHNQRDEYNKYWDDINQFIKYGVVRENGFYEKVRDAILYKSTNGEYFTLAEYLVRNEKKIGKKVIFTNDAQLHGQYIKLFEVDNVDCVELTSRLDNPFISHVEGNEEGLTFVRIDADPESVLGTKTESDNHEQLIATFKTNIEEDLVVEVQNFKTPDIPAMIFLDHESQKMSEFAKIYGISLDNMATDDGGKKKLVLNNTNPLVKALSDKQVDEGDANILCEHIWDMASLSHQHLNPQRMDRFIRRNVEILGKFIHK